MKKIILSLAIVLTLGLAANAQRGNDNFFGSYSSGYGNRATDGNMDNPNGLITLPGGEFGGETDQELPLGSGLIVLTALGAGYAVARRKK